MPRESIVTKIKRIEEHQYPTYMQSMQDCFSIKDVADYCECETEELIMVVSDKAYFLATPTEIVDIAGKVTLGFLKNILKKIKPLSGSVVKCDCRAMTYKWILFMSKVKRIEIVETSSWYWEDEKMIEIRIKVL